VEVPRDRNGEYQPQVLEQYQSRTNELEDKIIAMYAKGMTVRDIRDMVADTYGMTISAQMVSDITDKVIPLVEEWHSRPLAPVYPVLYLDAFTRSVRGWALGRSLEKSLTIIILTRVASMRRQTILLSLLKMVHKSV